MNPRASLARASSGANLAADSRHGTVDAVIALGAVSQAGGGARIVSAACALGRGEALPPGVESLPADLSAVRWAGDYTRLAKLVDAVRALVAWWAQRGGWMRRSKLTEPEQGEQLSRLADQLTKEAFRSEACGDCAGRGFRYDKAGRYQGACPSCHGTGVRAAPAVERAEALGVSRQAYYTTWAERCDELLGILMECDRRLMGRVRSKVGYSAIEV